jgi:uroporphyrinogen III methyltransferase/synthase
MGAGRVAEIAKALIAGGRDETTPVAAVRFGTRSDQFTVRATLGTIADAGVEPPSAIVVGDVAALDFSWFERRPLFGRTVVVTRAREQASELRARLAALGATVLELPAIRIVPVDFAVPDLTRYAWVVFTSANGVDAFFDRGLAPAGRDARALAPVRIAVIGPGTAAALARRELRADLVPERFVVLAVYRTGPAPVAADDLARIRAGSVDAITFTSSSTVDNFCDAVGMAPEPGPAVVSIGPITSETARRRGLVVDIEADPHTIDGLVEALLRQLGQ